MSGTSAGRGSSVAPSSKQPVTTLAGAAATRRFRHDLRTRLRHGSITVRDVFARARTDRTLGVLRVTTLLETFPGIDRTKALMILARTGINPSTRVRGLGVTQQHALIKELEASRAAPVRKSRTPRPKKSKKYKTTDTPTSISTTTVPISIYLTNETVHQQVEEAVGKFLTLSGIQVETRDDPISGSWFRRMRGKVADGARSPLARELATTAAHAADLRLSLAQDAQVTSTMMQHLAPVLASLHPTKDAVIRVGSLLIVKVDWIVGVHQLTAAQQLRLDHEPNLVSAPKQILTELSPQLNLIKDGIDDCSNALTAHHDTSQQSNA